MYSSPITRFYFVTMLQNYTDYIREVVTFVMSRVYNSLIHGLIVKAMMREVYRLITAVVIRVWHCACLKQNFHGVCFINQLPPVR